MFVVGETRVYIKFSTVFFDYIFFSFYVSSSSIIMMGIILLIGNIVIILVVLKFFNFEASYLNSPDFCMSSHESSYIFHESHVQFINSRIIFSFPQYENELFWKYCYRLGNFIGPSHGIEI